MLVNQPSQLPTRKLSAATAAAAFMAAMHWTLDAIAPGLPNAELTVGLTPVAVFIAGWFVKDAANTSESLKHE